MSEIKKSDFAPTVDPDASEAPAELVEFAVSDLKKSSVETLGSYMLSQAERNYYYPEEPIEQTTPDDSEVLGTPEPSDITAGADTHAFMADVLDAASAYYATITDGSTPDAVGGGTMGPLTDFLDKTSQTDGHALLAQVAGDTWSTVMESQPNTSENDTGQAVRDKVSDVLKYNRFQPGGESPYVQDMGYSDGMFSIQNDLGRYNPDAEKAALEELAKIAFSMMLTATGASESDSNPDSADSTNAIGQGIDVQLALSKVDTVNLQTSVAHGFPGKPPQFAYPAINQKGIRRKGTKTEDLDSKNSKSYGQLNSYLEPFDGPLPIGMIALAVIAAIAVLVAGVILAAVMTLIFLLFPPGSEEEPPEPLPLGAASGEPDFGKFSIRKWLMKMLRMPILRSGKIFLVAMFFGVIQFYYRILDAISSGYFIIISRAAIRDLEQISDALAEADFSNIVGGLESIFIVLDAFATSTTFQFLNTLAMLGDICLLSGGLFGKGPMEFSPYGSAAGQPDVTVPSIAKLHRKSRTLMSKVDPDYRLAWRFGSLPSRYLLPSNILAANSALGVNSAYAAALRISHGVGLEDGVKTQKFGGIASEDGPTPPTGKVRNNRFTADERQEFEDVLDAYYIPFYLQDLRTNEILALHTFVDNISDSFSPEWSAVSGFGRMDDVQIYKKTKRSIGLSFWMIATNPEDHDELYFAINKLVTMVYPQWSKGQVKADSDGNTFIMPFSQVPTASPLVRLRLGELFSSNYSMQNISRLFGLGTDSFTFAGVAPYGNSDITDAAGIEEKIDAILAAIQEKLVQIEAGAPEAVDALVANGLAATGMANVPQGFNVGDPVIVMPSKYKIVGWEAAQLNWQNVGGKLKIPDEVLEEGRKGTVLGYQIRPLLDVEGDDDAKSDTRVKKRSKVRYAIALSTDFDTALAESGGDAILCGHDDLQMDYEAQVLTTINEVLGGPTTGGIPNPFGDTPEPLAFEAADETKEFFGLDDINKNSIIRTFHESGGKGIAGAITQLDFDWNQAPWDERQGSRAPTYVKVTIGFAPIHDIPLGLDFQGGIRAPAYNVGGIVRGLFGAGPSPVAWENTKAALLKSLQAALTPTPPVEGDPGEGDL